MFALSHSSIHLRTARMVLAPSNLFCNAKSNNLGAFVHSRSHRTWDWWKIPGVLCCSTCSLLPLLPCGVPVVPKTAWSETVWLKHWPPFVCLGSSILFLCDLREKDVGVFLLSLLLLRPGIPNLTGRYMVLPAARPPPPPAMQETLGWWVMSSLN